MRKNLILSFMLVFLALSGYGCMRCQNNVIFTSPFVESFLSNYDYTLSDSTGKVIIEGTFRPKKFADPEISGVYVVTNLIDSRYSTSIPQGGEFSGTLDEKNKVGYVNLNPHIADNNVFLRFSVNDRVLLGTWEKSGMRGITEKGKFEATKKASEK